MSTIAQPQWIAKMYPPKSGMDHLGLGSVSSDQILPSLSPGINVLTIYPRYHSFYVFLLDEFWRRDLLRCWTSWMHFFRQRDFIFSVGVFLCDQPEHEKNITAVGGQKTAPLARQLLSTYTYKNHTDYIKSQWGGYGLYYRSVMIELGLLYPGGPSFPYPMDLPTEYGKQVAAAYRQAVQDTQYYQHFFDQDAPEVPLEVLQEYIRSACLCQLQVSTTRDRPFLLDSFLHGGEKRLAKSRRETFQLFLDIAEQTAETAIDQDTFRQLLYFQAAENGVMYHPRSSLEAVYRRWRYYQAREYYAFSLNALWCHLCSWGLNQGGDIHPLSLDQFWQYVDEGLKFNRLASQLKVSMPDLDADSSFLAFLQWLQNLVGADQIGFDAACTLDTPLNEQRLYRLALQHRQNPYVMIGGMLTMLSLMYLRFQGPDHWQHPAWEISAMGQDGRLSVADFIKSLRYRLQTHTTIRQVAQWLYKDYIILQHQLIADSKSPENTYRFQREGNWLRFFRLENSLGFMDSRFNALSTTVHELGLCESLSHPHRKNPLSPDGQWLLSEGDLS
jgi:hypothetical protein